MQNPQRPPFAWACSSSSISCRTMPTKAGILLHTRVARYGMWIARAGLTVSMALSPINLSLAQYAPEQHTVQIRRIAVDPINESGAGAYMSVSMVSRGTTPADVQPIIPQEIVVQPEVIVVPDPPVQPTRRPWSQRGVFLTSTSMGDATFRTHTLTQLHAVKGNAVVFDVKGSAVHFDALHAPLAQQLGLVKPQYTLAEVVRILHENGMYAIARYIAVKDHSLATQLPETNLRNPTTNRAISPGWIDPAHPKVLEYNREILCLLAASGVDEINLDYIRFDTRVGEVLGAYTDEERITKIETFIRMARDTIDFCGPSTKLGVSTFAILGWDYERNAGVIGQDVVRFAPMLDVISPMAYNANFAPNAYEDPSGQRDRWNYLVYRTLTGYADRLGAEHAWKLRPWLQGWEASAEDIRNQMQGVFDAGVCGFTVWNADNGYTDTYSAMSHVRIPQHCTTAAP